MLNYFKLYNNKTIEVSDKCWKHNLELNTINIYNQKIKITPSFS
jgi:hypothetical protein